MTQPTEQSAQQTGSKTPRTDAVIHNGSCSDAVNKYRELSRQLETSLAVMTAECERLRRENEHHKTCAKDSVSKALYDAAVLEVTQRAEASERELAAARRDAEDMLLQISKLRQMQPPVANIIGRRNDVDYALPIINTYLSNSGHVFVVAIDAAIKEKK